LCGRLLDRRARKLTKKEVKLDKNSTYGEGRLSAVLGEGTWHELLFYCGFKLMYRNNNKFCNLILAQDNLHV
jgi:hypothetical protein